MSGHREHRIARAVRGWLDSPAVDAVAGNCLIVSGWAFAAHSRIIELWITGLSGGRPRLVYGLERDDVARVYPDEAHARNSGFSGYVEFKPATGPVRFEVRARLDDGRTITLFKRRLPVAGIPRQASVVRAAVRQLLDHPQIVFSVDAWRTASRLLSRSRSASSRRLRSPDDRKRSEGVTAITRLPRFLESGAFLTFPASASPVVSIVVVVWNRAELTLECLHALSEKSEVSFELIVVDNASTDDTGRLLDRMRGATVVRNATNLGFTLSANIGARAARGEFLLFLNNDATLERGSLGALVAAARRSDAIGAVGGKLVYPDGRLQEAGSVIWADGSCEGYGRGGDPAAPEYCFERQVDFCSGAMLLTRRDIFERLGGFDERYQPAYYEDADYCVRLWKSGRSVVYNPQAVAVHHEFGSAPSAEASIELQRDRRAVFVARHQDWLAAQSPRADGVLAARAHPHRQPSFLFIDDAVPDPAHGAGFPRSAALLDALVQRGGHVTMYVTNGNGRPRVPDRFASVETFGAGPHGLRAFLASRSRYDAVVVSRPHNMQHLKAAAGSNLSRVGGPCIYDAEALYALREIGRRELAGEPMTPNECRELIDAELYLTSGCQAILTVSQREREVFQAMADVEVSVVAHAVDASPTARPFTDRRTILFVGAFGSQSPNEDAALYFCSEVLPALRMLQARDFDIIIAGARIPDHVRAAAAAQGATCRSDVDDLTALYDEARVFVAPTRYAAGIPLKVVEAAAHGVPVVATPLIALQLGWRDGSEILIGAGPAEFARAITSVWTDERLWAAIRESALQRVATEYSPVIFRTALHRAIDAARSMSGSVPGECRV